MTELTGLAMTDVASRSTNGRVWKLGLLLGFFIILYVACRNYLYLQAGMLAPNFTIIRQAYNFNLF